jgi:protein-disulfide isomerase
MPSGKRARQQRQETAAKTPPPVRSKGSGGGRTRQASPRALAIGGGILLVVVLAIVLGFVLSGGGSGNGGQIVSASDMTDLPATGSQSWGGSLQGADEANALFKGIPQHGLTLGDPKAPVTMEMFIDLQCPVCDDYEINHLPAVVKQYVRDGKVQLHLKPWAFLGGPGSQSFSGRYGLIAAAQQNRAFEYAKVLYDNQGEEESGWLTGQKMAQIAASVDGLDLARWRTDTNGSGVQATAAAVDSLAKQKKVGGTPTIFVGPTGGKLLLAMPNGEYVPADVAQALSAAVANSK